MQLGLVSTESVRRKCSQTGLASDAYSYSTRLKRHNHSETLAGFLTFAGPTFETILRILQYSGGGREDREANK